MTEKPIPEPRSGIVEGQRILDEVKRMVDEGKQGPEVARYLFGLGVKDMTLASEVLIDAGFLTHPTPDAQGVSISFNLYTGELHPRTAIVRLDPPKKSDFQTEPE
jgi:hypothetical protein